LLDAYDPSYEETPAKMIRKRRSLFCPLKQMNLYEPATKHVYYV